MEREAFRQRMQQYKQARENNPQLKYWDWKKENDLGYQLYKNNLPSNLQVETDDYDLYGAYESNMQPELNEDGTYHLGSRDPYTGRILKSKQHPTYQKAIESEISAGYFPYEKNNITYTKTYSPVDISGYADGGIIDEDPPQSTSERPITNFDPKGDPYNPTYGYNPGAGYVSNSDPLGSLYVEGALLNPVFKLAGNAVSNVARGLTKYSSNRRQPAGYDDFEYQINRNLTEIDYPTTRHELGHYVDFNLAKSSNPDYSNSMFAELKRDLSKQKNPLFPDKTDYYSKGTEQKSYMNTLREYMFKNGMINNIGDKVTSRQIKKAIRSLPKDMRSIEAAYLQFATPGQYTKWFNKIPLLSTYPIVNKQFQNYEEDKDKARKQR